MTNVSNIELFEELFNFIKKPETTITDAIKEHGGVTYYIPSYKTTCRNDDIINEYRKHYGETGLAKKLAKKYNLTERQIYDITKEVRETPSLF